MPLRNGPNPGALAEKMKNRQLLLIKTTSRPAISPEPSCLNFHLVRVKQRAIVCYGFKKIIKINNLKKYFYKKKCHLKKVPLKKKGTIYKSCLKTNAY